MRFSISQTLSLILVNYKSNYVDYDLAYYIERFYFSGIWLVTQQLPYAVFYIAFLFYRLLCSFVCLYRVVLKKRLPGALMFISKLGLHIYEILVIPKSKHPHELVKKTVILPTTKNIW